MYIRSGIRLKPFVNFFVDIHSFPAMGLGAGWKNTGLLVHYVYMVAQKNSVMSCKYRKQSHCCVC